LIALFGPTNPEIWAPLGKNKFYIKKGNDINLIEVQDVIDKINLILQQKEKEK
jgi:heptosyltransferase-2